MPNTTEQLKELTHDHITTSLELPGYMIMHSRGIVQGVIVRSRSVIGSFGASIQTLFGGNISLYTSLAEKTRQQAFDKMIANARRLGANAIIGVRYDSTELGAGITEVICYGTAVLMIRSQ